MAGLSDMINQEIAFHIAPKRKPLLRSFTEYILSIEGDSVITNIRTENNFTKKSISSKVQSVKSQDDLYKCLRPLLRFARVIGIVPLSGLFVGQSDLDDVSFRRTSFAGITSISHVIAMILHFGIRVILAAFLFRAAGARDLLHIAENAASVIFAISGAYVYYFMYSNIEQLISCLHAWRQYKHSFPQLYDPQLQKHINLVAGTFLTSAIVQNALTHWNVLPSSRTTSLSLLETYYEKHFPHYSDVIPYNPILTMSLFICDKWNTYAWTFGDILVAVIARAFYKQFQLHADKLENDLVNTTTSIHYYTKLLEEHERIVTLLEKFNNFLRPLIFACLASDIYFIAITLNRFLVSPSPSSSVAEEKPHIILLMQVNSVWSFLHLLTKTFIAVIYCARVNAQAHRLEGILCKCPINAYTKEVERSELKLRTGRIGFTGLDYFTITKPFILTVFNVVFTLEIVLLQSSATSTGSA